MPIFRKRKITTGVATVCKNKKKDSWTMNGDINRFYESKQLVNSIFKEKDLFSKEKVNNIMFLGPGKGEDLHNWKKTFKNNKYKTSFDVLGLENTITESVKKDIVNRDFSIGRPVEHIDPTRDSRDKRLFDHLNNKYSLVVSQFGVSYHTKHPSYNLFASSLLLKKEGVLYSSINSSYIHLKAGIIKYNRVNSKIHSKELDKLEKHFHKFVEIYNKQKKTNLKFEFDIRDIDNLFYVRIKRIN
ncbi:MAG: hypothetical protein PHR26_03910 [Candidatus ainarchaeum sp.]|nr:hypothetical protein [Candidatus ainarchaeum sp.]MDD3976274.1 hypothetical protein [Candidatus ainarchaeum sp.]